MEKVFLTAQFWFDEDPERSEPACVPAYRIGKVQAATGEQSVVMVCYTKASQTYTSMTETTVPSVWVAAKPDRTGAELPAWLAAIADKLPTVPLPQGAQLVRTAPAAVVQPSGALLVSSVSILLLSLELLHVTGCLAPLARRSQKLACSRALDALADVAWSTQQRWVCSRRR